jgi:hypothetical protein
MESSGKKLSQPTLRTYSSVYLEGMRKKAIKHLSGQPITRRRFELAAS